jgi:hypothetical protein
MAAPSADAVEQLARGRLEPTSHAHEGGEADVPLSALQPTDLRRVQIARGGQEGLAKLVGPIMAGDVGDAAVGYPKIASDLPHGSVGSAVGKANARW